MTKKTRTKKRVTKKAVPTKVAKKAPTKKAAKPATTTTTLPVMPLNVVNQFVKFDTQIKLLNEKRNALALKVFGKTGETSMVVPMEKPSSDKNFARVSLVDNMKKLTNGETVFKATGISPVAVAISFLKNNPKK